MTTPNLQTTINSIKAQYPKFKMVLKSDSAVMKFLGHILGPNFLSNFATTFLNTIYIPSNFYNWTVEQQVGLLLHESQHIKQWQTYNVLYIIGYLFLLPIGFNWFRARFEFEAYKVQMQFDFSCGLDIMTVEYKTRLLNHFISSDYGWMLPIPGIVNGWIDDAVKEITAIPPT